MTRKNWLIVGLMAGLLGVVGCGDDDGTTSTPDPDMGPMDGGGDDMPTDMPTAPFAECEGRSAGMVMVSEDITADTVWCAIETYRLTNAIFVRGGTLFIQPGTTVLGGAGGAEGENAIIVTVAGRMEAVGTVSAPITFTSANEGAARRPGDWGGVVLLGDATLNEQAGVANIEGLPPGAEGAQYGGSNDAADCGSLRYVRIQYAGFEFGGANELNGLTLGGCGTGTDLDFIQSHGGLDDGIEFFGGTANGTHFVVSSTEDDGLDTDQGYLGTVQFIIVQGGGGSDHGFEMDNSEDAPFTNTSPISRPKVWNGTLFGEGVDGQGEGIELAENTHAELRNILIANYPFNECIDLDDEQQVDACEAGDCVLEGVLTTNCETDILVDPTSTFDFATGNRFGETGMFLTDPANQDFTPAGGADLTTDAVTPTNLPNDEDFDATATYIGAIEPGGTDWTQGWTDYPALGG